MVSIQPTPNEEIETILEDSKRFDDISQLVYLKNQDHFKKYLRKQREANKITDTDQNILIKSIKKNEVKFQQEKRLTPAFNQINIESAICSIL